MRLRKTFSGREELNSQRKIKFLPKKENTGQDHSQPRNYKYLLYFASFVAFCVVIAIGIRVAILVKNSTFNASSYAVLVKANDPFLLVLDRTSGTLTTLQIKPSSNNLKTSIDYTLPVDGVIERNEDISPDGFLSINTFIASFLRPGMFRYDNMNSVDVLKFINSSFSVSSDQRKTYSLSVSKDGDVSGLSQGQMYDILKDSDMVNEAISIEVVNATSIDGMASKVAQLIKNIGGNVVSVTSDDNKSVSGIYSKDSSVTVDRLSHLLRIPATKKREASTADIVIILGEDFVRKVR